MGADKREEAEDGKREERVEDEEVKGRRVGLSQRFRSLPG